MGRNTSAGEGDSIKSPLEVGIVHRLGSAPDHGPVASC
jgi:hypothetical protein